MILSQKMGLSCFDCYHEVCRLLGKINAAHQLSELCALPAFQAWMDSVYQFTVESVRSINTLPNSKHYLLGFWASIVNPLIYLKEKAPKNLDSCIQQITLMYLESRIILADTPSDPDVEDPLEDEVLRAEQLDVIASLGRCKYQDTAQYILQKFEEVQSQGTTGAMLSAVYEKKLTWIVYMMGALVGGHSGCKPNRTDTEGMPTHVVNGEIASRVFRLLTQTDVQPNASELLESAYLYFIEQFRKVYIGEHAKQVVQQEVNERLCTVLGLEDENAVLSVLIKKIGTNLQKRYHMESVLKKTLLLFHELAAGINIVHSNDRSPHLIVSGRLLLKNETVKSVRTNNASTGFGFLHGGVAFGKYRTMYYHSLAKLLFMEIRDNRSVRGVHGSDEHGPQPALGDVEPECGESSRAAVSASARGLVPGLERCLPSLRVQRDVQFVVRLARGQPEEPDELEGVPLLQGLGAVVRCAGGYDAFAEVHGRVCEQQIAANHVRPVLSERHSPLPRSIQ